MQYLINRLKEKGLKVTPQRIAIAQTIQKEGHIDIEELYSIMSKAFPTISLATLYKNINSFLEKSFIVEVHIPNHKTKYELVNENHAHFICTRCGKIRDLQVDEKLIYTAIEKSEDINIEKLERFSCSVYGNCCNS
jgi:Fur family peroxide stress response transcriptional regulator